MSARENLLRKSCRAPADNHFVYVSHRQYSCGKKDLYQRFFTTDENVTLSVNTRLPSFLADRQSAVLKRAKEVLGGLSGKPGKLRSSGVKFRAANDQQSSGFRSFAFDRHTFAERLLRRGPTFWFPLYGGCAAAVSAREVDRGSGIWERVAGWLDAIHSGNRVENHLALGVVSFWNQAVQFDRAEFHERTLVGPMDGGIVNDISLRRHLNHNAHL